MSATMPWRDVLCGSVILRLTGHSWVNIIHGAVLGGLFLMTIVAAMLVVLQARQGDLTEEGAARSARWLARSCVAMVVMGWLAVLTGTFVVDVWFHARSAVAPASLLEASPTYPAWGSLIVRLKEWVSWAGAIAATAAAIVAFRQGWRIVDRPRVRRSMIALLGAAFALAALGGALGVLLAKLAPLM
jgi:hypothetical protein